MPRLRKKKEDYAPDYVPEPEETPEPSSPDIALGDEELLGDSEQQAHLYDSYSTYEDKKTKPDKTTETKPDPSENIDETEESTAYVSRSTYERIRREPPPEPVLEDVIQEHKQLVIDDLVDVGEQDLGAELADDYLSHSTYVLEPTPPKEAKPTKHRRRTVEDFGPEDESIIADADKLGIIYDSESTYEVAEMGSVVLESADKFIERAKKTKTETKIVSPSTYELDDLEGAAVGEELGEIYESRSTYEVEKSLEATELYLTGVALSGGVSFVRGASYTVNPLEWVRGAHDLTYLSKSRYAQKQFAEHASEDPLRFLVDTGAALAGGYYAGKFMGNLYRGVKEAELKAFYNEFPEEAFYLEDGIPDPAIPEQVSVQKSSFTGFDKKKVRIDFESGGTEGLYFGANPLDEGASVSKATNIPDESLSTIWELDGDKMRISMDQGRPKIDGIDDLVKIDKPKKGLIYQLGDEYGLVETGHDLVPVILPEGVGRIETIYIPRTWIEYETSHLPGVTGLPPYFDSALGLSPFVGKLPTAGAGSGLLTGLPSIDEPIPDTKTTVIKEIQDIDDTRIGEIPKTIEMLDETYKQEQELVDPMTILKPIHDPIEDIWTEPGYKEKEEPVIIDRLDEDTTPTPYPPDFIQEQTQEQVQEEIYDVPFPVPLDLFDPTRHQRPRPPRTTPKKTRKVKRKDPYDPMGWEMREYPVQDIEDILGIDFSQKEKTKTKKKKTKTKRRKKKK